MSNIQKQNNNMEALTVKSLFNRDDVKNKFQELLGKRASSFITSVLQIVSQNQLLSKAEPASVYQAAAVAATLDLPLNNNLGFAYIVPYNQSYKDENGQWKKKQVAQFQMGYKGFIQLAQRSGQFRTIAAAPIYEGQLIEENPLTGFVFDFKVKKSNKVIGYASYFELLNGFEKTLYLSVDQVNIHGGKYSQTFTNEKGLWKTDFEGMATKTVLKLLLSKFAPLSIEMQRAVVVDQSLINDYESNDITYVDNEEIVINKEEERTTAMLLDCKTINDLVAIKEQIPEEYQQLYNKKLDQLQTKEVA